MYGGTSSEMHRLLLRAAELDETFAKTANFSIDSKGHLEAEFADITQAIHIVQTEMGITGTTALEAGATIEGSVNSMKGAWTNLLTGLANGNANIEQLVDDLVTTIVGDGTESNLGVIGNILPAVETALNGAGKLIENILPIIIDKIPEFIENYLPKILEAGVSIVLEIALGLVKAIPSLVKTIPQIISSIIDVFKSKSGDFANIGKSIVDGIKNGILKSWDALVGWVSAKWNSLMSIFSINVGKSSGTSAVNGSHANGLSYVPFDGYIAELHKGEAVLTSLEADDYRKGKTNNSGNVNIVQNIYSEAKTAADLMQEALYMQERAVWLGV